MKDKIFLNIAKEIRKLSKDPSTKVGAVIVSLEGYRVIAAGYNGLPSKYPDNYDNITRDEKNLISTHAEVNAILNAAKNGAATKDCAIYVTELPCAACASAIINSGIKKVVVPLKGSLDSKRWEKSCNLSLEVFETCGVELVKITEDN